MTDKVNMNAIPLNNIKDFVKANVALQCSQLHAPRLAIQGAPGTGKSDIIREICEENGWVLSVKYLSNMSLEQITGIPCRVESGSTAIWSKPELFNFDFPEYAPENAYANGNKPVTILLIDDFHLADKIMQRYLFQLLTYKSLNGYKLPENTAILLAGNRNTDKALANSIPAPVCNRLLFMEVTSNTTDWLNNFAFKHGIRNDITSFLYQYGDVYLASEPVESAAWASPRAWTYLSYQMDAYEKMMGKIGIEQLKNMANGLIGVETACKFIEYRELFAKWDFTALKTMGLDEAKKVIETEINANPTDVYAIISAGTAWVINAYKTHDYKVDDPIVHECIEFLYQIFIYLMLFPKNNIRRNTRPLLAAGTKYLQMYQKVTNCSDGNALIYALTKCMENSNDCDIIFYDLLATVFDFKLTKAELNEINEAKTRVNYEY